MPHPPRLAGGPRLRALIKRAQSIRAQVDDEHNIDQTRAVCNDACCILDFRRTEAALRDAKEAAEAATIAKDIFLANLSHEMRTPLNIMMGFTHLALKDDLPPGTRACLEKIGTAADTLLALINDLLDLSKISAGHLEIAQAPFALRELVGRVTGDLRAKAEEKGLALRVHLADDLPPHLLGDALRIEQILVNLAGNAIKFTTTGTVDLRLFAVRRTPLGAPQLRLCIEVADTGCGMSREQIARLFRPFSQADSSISRRFGGTGLGLTICKRLAEAMGGSITVMSAPGRGSRFRVEIQLAASPKPPPPPPPPLPVVFANVRVLLVDDHPLNRQLVMDLLADQGIAVDPAADGHEALELLTTRARSHYDAVLMDIQMPEMDGLAATRAIRREHRLVDLPIIALTAHTMRHEIESALAAGMNDHLGKPIDPVQLIDKLAFWVGPVKCRCRPDKGNASHLE